MRSRGRRGRERGHPGLVSMANTELPIGIPGHQLLSLFDVFLKMSALLMVPRAIMNLFINERIFGSFFRDFMSKGLYLCLFNPSSLPNPFVFGQNQYNKGAGPVACRFQGSGGLPSRKLVLIGVFTGRGAVSLSLL